VWKDNVSVKRQLRQQADSIFERPTSKVVYAMDNGNNALRIWQVTFEEGIPVDIPSQFIFY